MQLPKLYSIELTHVQNIKKINIARLIGIIEFYDPDFINVLAFTDPRVKKFIGYYFEFIEKNPYGYEASEPQNLFGNWDFIKYKLKILFPALSLEELDEFKFKRKDFVEYVKNKLGENEISIETKLNKATWYETIPYLELEDELSKEWHIEPVMTDEDWKFIKKHINGRKNILINEDGKDKLVYIDIEISDEALDKYRNDRDGLINLLMDKYRISKEGAEQILRKAGWESTNYHIIPPLHTDVILDYGENLEAKGVDRKYDGSSDYKVADFIRYIGGLELEELNYMDLIYGKLESEVQEILDRIIRTQRKILGKLFGIFYTTDPIMAEAIIAINPEKLYVLRENLIKETVRNKHFSLYSNEGAWKTVKNRIVSVFADLTEDDIEEFRGKRKEFMDYLVEKTGKSREYIENKLEECGWNKHEEIPPFLRHIGP